jgi:DNA-binding transcriptional MerR regulator
MKKLYHSIGEVSQITDVKPHVLRYWESLFNELHPNKNKAGKRVYTDKDIETILRLKELIKGQKFSTAGAKKAIRKQTEVKNESVVLPVHVQRELKEIRHFLNQLLHQI